MMYVPYDEHSRQQANQRLVQNVAKAIDGEYSATVCYEQLIRQAPTSEERRKIREIRADEERHLQIFSEIYRSLTGRQHRPQMTEACPPTYREGLRAAFKDEQKTVDFYLDIADQAPTAFIRRQFRRAAADEQHHAVWFLYYLTNRVR